MLLEIETTIVVCVVLYGVGLFIVGFVKNRNDTRA